MAPLVLLLIGAASALAGYYECEPCHGEECFAPPEGCLYGAVLDPCGRMRCMAGPGQACGGRDNHRGKCGSGMTCKCGKCNGCSIDRLRSGVVECDYKNPICY